jgi:hypothetical protein
MSADLRKYQKHLASLELSGRQKDELLSIVWITMERFVHRAFGDDNRLQRAPANDNRTTSQSDGVHDKARSEARRIQL